MWAGLIFHLPGMLSAKKHQVWNLKEFLVFLIKPGGQEISEAKVFWHSHRPKQRLCELRLWNFPFQHFSLVHCSSVYFCIFQKIISLPLWPVHCFQAHSVWLWCTWARASLSNVRPGMVSPQKLKVLTDIVLLFLDFLLTMPCSPFYFWPTVWTCSHLACSGAHMHTIWYTLVYFKHL